MQGIMIIDMNLNVITTVRHIYTKHACTNMCRYVLFLLRHYYERLIGYERFHFNSHESKLSGLHRAVRSGSVQSMVHFFGLSYGFRQTVKSTAPILFRAFKSGQWPKILTLYFRFDAQLLTPMYMKINERSLYKSVSQRDGFENYYFSGSMSLNRILLMVRLSYGALLVICVR